MATQEQIEANRRNAQLSTGPRTQEGKKASSLNAYRHGLTGQIEVMTDEEKEIHDNFCAAIIASLHPADAIESQYAQSIAEGHWRLNRARTIENNMFTLAASFDEENSDESDHPEIDKALAAARTFIADPARFQLLTIYEMRINRKTQNDLKQLRELQATRLALEEKERTQEAARQAQALDEARLLLHLDETEGAPIDLTADFHHPNGFVFSNAGIVDSIRFERRLDLARQAIIAAQSAVARPPIRRAA
jgi:hypothetical protein